MLNYSAINNENLFVALFLWLHTVRVAVSYGSEYKRFNQRLLARVERIDSQFAECNELNPTDYG